MHSTLFENERYGEYFWSYIAHYTHLVIMLILKRKKTLSISVLSHSDCAFAVQTLFSWNHDNIEIAESDPKGGVGLGDQPPLVVCDYNYKGGHKYHCHDEKLEKAQRKRTIVSICTLSNWVVLRADVVWNRWSTVNDLLSISTRSCPVFISKLRSFGIPCKRLFIEKAVG